MSQSVVGKKRVRAFIQGRIQGVGFRPWVYREAKHLGLTGFVYNTPQGVQLELQGDSDQIDLFFQTLTMAPPPLARIEQLEADEIALQAEIEFLIIPSELEGETSITFPPDVATCKDCEHELFAENDRRYQYPFINCLNCGPRFTIIQDLPYDRKRTTMDKFPLCAKCAREFNDPRDRRFESQPNACPNCGPQLQLISADRQVYDKDPMAKAVELLRVGKILAIKGLGGYHLACDATRADVIETLRERKHRPYKSLAVMFVDLKQIKAHCRVKEKEAEELQSYARPIVVLERLAEQGLPQAVSPDTQDVGVFLPYTPIHHLLLKKMSPLIMTSANPSEEPMVTNERELEKILGPIADYALTHDRPIARHCDDSVLKIVEEKRLFYRRARGFVPRSLTAVYQGPSLVATGADLKNTFCLTRKQCIYPSSHMGDLSLLAVQHLYQEQMRNLCDLQHIQPEVIVHDMHPDYFSTRFALKTKISWKIAVQHHHAHIAACMLEHQLDEKVIGIALDGTGFGPDETLWGGEIILADYKTFERKAHFKTYRMPGGEQAILHPDRMALSYVLADVSQTPEDAQALLPSLSTEQCRTLKSMLEQKAHSPLTSSAGRLFDVVAAIMGLCDTVTYEGQAAIRLQSLVDTSVHAHYPYALELEPEATVLSFAPMIKKIIADIQAGRPLSQIATKFHNTLVTALAVECEQIRTETGLSKVVLSGGVFQNDFLLRQLTKRLRQQGFAVYSHHLVPPNDGGVSVGQAAIGLAKCGTKLKS
ncbi:carbamoyltransferase HypF [bacterium]|nr:carbamoyltransferase HypF [bacterium]